MKVIKKLNIAIVLVSLFARSICTDDSVMRGEYHKEVKAKKVVAGDLFVQDHAKFFGCAHVDKDLEVDGKLDVDHCADFGKDVDIHGSLKVHDKLHVHRDAEFCKDVHVDDDLCVGDDVLVGDELKVCGDFFLKGHIKTRCPLDESVQKIDEACHMIDVEFNATGALSVPFLLNLGFYDEHTSISLHGPFTPDVCGHRGHLIQPGALRFFGAIESAAAVAGTHAALLVDPYFPYCDLACAVKVHHQPNIVTAVINNELINVAETIEFRYPGENGPIVAIIQGVLQYRLKCCEDKVETPAIVWGEYTIKYIDCALTCPPCTGVPC